MPYRLLPMSDDVNDDIVTRVVKQNTIVSDDEYDEKDERYG